MWRRAMGPRPLANVRRLWRTGARPRPKAYRCESPCDVAIGRRRRRRRCVDAPSRERRGARFPIGARGSGARGPRLAQSRLTISGIGSDFRLQRFNVQPARFQVTVRIATCAVRTFERPGGRDIQYGRLCVLNRWWRRGATDVGVVIRYASSQRWARRGGSLQALVLGVLRHAGSDVFDKVDSTVGSEL